MNRTDVMIHGSRNQSSFTYNNNEHDYVSAKKKCKKRKEKKIQVSNDKTNRSVP
jgi:outer membrane protein assembly factor BamE (lipoprotein component of BamABCDE complex)